MRRFLLAYIQCFGLSLTFSSTFARPSEQVLVLEARSNAPVVDVGYAQYAGVIDTTTGNTEFLGIRYAAPPTGTLCRPPPTPFIHHLLVGSMMINILQEVCAGVPHGHRH